MPQPTTKPGAPSPENSRIGRLLWLDCSGALMAGIVVIGLSGWLGRLEGLPRGALLFMGGMNLLYGSFSLFLAQRAERPVRLIQVLALANMVWAPVCLGLLAAFSTTVTPITLVHLGGEALYVGGLGLLEWRNRELLRKATGS